MIYQKLEPMEFVEKCLALSKLHREIYDNDRSTEHDTIYNGTAGSVTNEIHIFTGIEHLAECVGKDIKIANDNSEHDPYSKYFVYNGVKFFQLLDVREKVKIMDEREAKGNE